MAAAPSNVDTRKAGPKSLANSVPTSGFVYEPRTAGKVIGLTEMTASDAVDGSFHRRGSAKEVVADKAIMIRREHMKAVIRGSSAW